MNDYLKYNKFCSSKQVILSFFSLKMVFFLSYLIVFLGM